MFLASQEEKAQQAGNRDPSRSLAGCWLSQIPLCKMRGSEIPRY